MQSETRPAHLTFILEVGTLAMLFTYRETFRPGTQVRYLYVVLHGQVVSLFPTPHLAYSMFDHNSTKMTEITTHA
jgi:hypothetical protein